MIFTETEIWNRFNNDKPILIDSKWLERAYSLNLSIKLRYIISERLGLLANRGWRSIKILIKKHGHQPELINAAGLCHQIEARDFLLKCLNAEKEPQLITVKALACWGAVIPNNDLKRILNHNSKAIRLAGLNMLNYKAHLLNSLDLLDLVEDLLNDFREEIVIKTIKVLQRRNEDIIVNRISKVASNGTEKVVEIVLIALGSIETEQSIQNLLNLTQELNNKNHRKLAKKQLSHKYMLNY